MMHLYVKMYRLYKNYFRICHFLKLSPFLFIALLISGSVLFSGCSKNTPKPEEPALLETLRKENSKAEYQTLTQTLPEKETPEKSSGMVYFFRPLTLKDAISYALTHNIDAEVKKLEKDIQQETAHAAKFKMLPSLTVEGTLSRRDTYDASSSDPLFTEGQEAYNYSRNKTTLMANAELSWDLIDFGISYYQFKQAKNRISILEQQRKRVVQNLKFNIIKTFWEIQVSKQAMDMAKKLILDLSELEKTLEKQITSQTTSQLDALETAAALSEMKLKLSEFEYQFRKSMTQMSMLMGLPEKTRFEIKDADFDTVFITQKMDIERLEKEALNNRPELYEQDVEEIITLDEARIATIEKFPKTSLFYRYDYDKDPHLYYDQWQTAGIRISFDLLSLPEKQSRSGEIAVRREFVKKKRLSIASAILTQLNLSVIEFEEAKRTFDFVDDIAENRRRIVVAQKQYADSGIGIWEDVIKNEVKYLFAHVRKMSAYADMIVADQRIGNTLGRDQDREEHLFLNIIKKPDNNNVPPKPTDNAIITDAQKIGSPIQKLSGVGPKGLIGPIKPVEVIAPRTEKTILTKKSYPFTLQLSSYQSLEKAVKMFPAYEKKGLSPYIVKMNPVGKGEWFRCYAGAFQNPWDGNKIIESSGFKGALVTHTPYANLVGVYQNDKASLSMKQKLIGMGYYPYSIEIEQDRIQLYIGAFYYEKDAVDLKEELQKKGVPTQVVLR